jgi:uncharacterized protein YaiE (UPF0345 family)
LPKLTAEDKTPVGTYSIRLRTDVYAQIVAYGSYLNETSPSTIGHVITEAFNAAVKGDPDWKTFWDKNAQKFQIAAANAAPARRGRKPKSQPRAA